MSARVWAQRRAPWKADCSGCCCGLCGLGACWRMHFYDLPCKAHQKGERVTSARRGRARIEERARMRRAWTSQQWGWQWPWGSPDAWVRRAKKDAARRACP